MIEGDSIPCRYDLGICPHPAGRGQPCEIPCFAYRQRIGETCCVYCLKHFLTEHAMRTHRGMAHGFGQVNPAPEKRPSPLT